MKAIYQTKPNGVDCYAQNQINFKNFGRYIKQIAVDYNINLINFKQIKITVYII